MKYSQIAVASAITFALGVTCRPHGTLDHADGDKGGSTLGVGFDPNVVTKSPKKNEDEKDAVTIGNNIRKAGFGTLNGKKQLTVDMEQKANDALPGPMPQVDQTLKVTYLQMVLDGLLDPKTGATAFIDPTNTGKWDTALEAKLGDVPDNIRSKKAEIQGTTVVGNKGEVTVTMPPGLTECTGPNKTCALRLVNSKNTGNNRWGGHAEFQLARGTGQTGSATLTPETIGNNTTGGTDGTTTTTTNPNTTTQSTSGGGGTGGTTNTASTNSNAVTKNNNTQNKKQGKDAKTDAAKTDAAGTKGKKATNAGNASGVTKKLKQRQVDESLGETLETDKTSDLS